MSSNSVIAAIFGLYLLASLAATIYCRKRGFTGLRLFLLVTLIWLVPVVGAGCAIAAAWERVRKGTGVDRVPDIWLAAGSSELRGGIENGRNGQ